MVINRRCTHRDSAELRRSGRITGKPEVTEPVPQNFRIATNRELLKSEARLALLIRVSLESLSCHLLKDNLDHHKSVSVTVAPYIVSGGNHTGNYEAEKRSDFPKGTVCPLIRVTNQKQAG